MPSRLPPGEHLQRALQPDAPPTDGGLHGSFRSVAWQKLSIAEIAVHGAKDLHVRAEFNARRAQTHPCPAPPRPAQATAFRAQAAALFAKNAAQQRRAWKTNLFIVVAPLIFCVLLLVLQKVMNNALDVPENRVGAGNQIRGNPKDPAMWGLVIEAWGASVGAGRDARRELVRGLQGGQEG